MEYVLQTKNLEKTYGKYEVLRGLTMNVPKGAIYGFIGKNGAGKMAVLILCGYLLMASFAAMFTFVSMLVTNEAASLLICFGIVLFCFVLGLWLVNLSMNVAWVATLGETGIKRAVFWSNFFPGGQMMMFFNMGGVESFLNPAVMVGNWRSFMFIRVREI